MNREVAGPDLPSLFDAVVFNPSIDVLQRIVAIHPEQLRQRGQHGQLPLHHALYSPIDDRTSPINIDTIKFLVQHYPESVREKDHEGWLPLHAACAASNLASEEIFEFLVVQYPKGLREKDSSQCLPVHRALLHWGLPLHTMKFMVDKYPKCVKVKDKFGFLPLHLAANNDRVSYEVLHFLLKKHPEGARVKDTSLLRLPLHLGLVSRFNTARIFSERSMLEVVKLLVEAYPASVRQREKGEMLPLHRAVTTAFAPLEVIQYLCTKYPAAVKLTLPCASLPLHIAVAMTSGCFYEIPEYLIEQFPQGAAARDIKGYLPLHRAVESGPCVRVVQLLIKEYPQALREKTYDHGYLPLHVAMLDDDATGTRKNWWLDVMLILVREYPLAVREAATFKDLEEYGGGLWLPALRIAMITTGTMEDQLISHLEIIYFCIRQYPDFIV